MLIRKMAPSDTGAISKIEQESLSPWSPAQIAAELDCVSSLVLAALDDSGELIGWCCTRFVGSEAELLKIGVKLTMRRKGIAGALFTRLESDLTGKGVETIFLEVRSRNSAAIGLYEKLGFHEVGIRRSYYANPQDNALIFRKELLYSEG